MSSTYEIAFESQKIITDELYTEYQSAFALLLSIHENMLLSLQMLYDQDGENHMDTDEEGDDVYQLSAAPGEIASIIVSSALLESGEEVSSLSEMVMAQFHEILDQMPFLSIVIREYTMA